MQPESVGHLLGRLKSLIEPEFMDTFVEGEVSNLSPSSSGHWYFNLSDENSSISCALFKMDAMRNPLIRQLKDGDKVWCQGPISLYAKRGSFQLIAKKITLAGAGDLKARFEKLKLKLSNEGLFDLSKKKAIPKFPQQIGIITALSGAALQDFINVFNRRASIGKVLVIPALVQGDAAPNSIMKAIDQAMAYGKLDVLVFARGGGSMEDLWAFNDENLIRKMATIQVPTISAIGHQVDFTLSDYVCDLRCETPTAAAEILTQAQMELAKQMANLAGRMCFSVSTVVNKLDRRLSDYHPGKVLEKLSRTIQNNQQRLLRMALKERAYDLVPWRERQLFLDELIVRLFKSMERIVMQNGHRLEQNYSLLKAFSPHLVLERGYSIIKSGDNIISSVSQFNLLSHEQNLEIVFKDGSGQVRRS